MERRATSQKSGLEPCGRSTARGSLAATCLSGWRIGASSDSPRRDAIVDDTTHSVSSWSEEYAYDSRGRVTQVDNGLGAFDYAYVGQTSRVDHIDYPNGMKVEYDYFGSAGDHLLQQIKNLSAGPSPAMISQFDYTYNQDRTIDTWRVEQGGQASKWTYGYDEVQQLTDAIRETLSGTVLEEERYVYDKAGNRISVTTGTTTISTRNYKVNNLNQLVSERGFGPTMFSGTVDQPVTVTVDGAPAKVMSTNGGAPFRFERLVDLAEGTNDVVVEATNGDGTVATKTYRVTTTGTTTLYEYDPNGNLRFERDAAGVVQREYRWDQENRLVALLEGTKESQYTYNGKSQRVRIRKLDGGVEQSNHEYVWCHEDRFCQKRSGSPPVVDRNYFEQGFTEGAYSYTSAKDHLMSVRETVADDGATVESRLDFGPYGDVRASGSGVESDHEFTGHFEDEDLAMTHFRVYDPFLGRWLSRDPLGPVDSLNEYAYTSNSPINKIDPNGLTSVMFDVGRGVLTVDPEDGSSPYTIPASSGRGPYMNDSDAEGSPSQGPIPRGNYTLKPSEIDDPPPWYDYLRNKFLGDWGDWRTPLHPSPGNRMGGRDGFFMHGGANPGSAGCIDIGGGLWGNANTNRVKRDLRNDDDDSVPVRVCDRCSGL